MNCSEAHDERRDPEIRLPHLAQPLHFVDLVIGAGQARGVVVIYALFDLINLIAVSLVVLAVSGQERY